MSSPMLKGGQGRTSEDVESSAAIAFFAIVGMAVLLAVAVVCHFVAV